MNFRSKNEKLKMTHMRRISTDANSQKTKRWSFKSI